MRGIAAVFLLLVLTVGAILGVSSGTGATAKPTLRLADMQPLVLKGRSFKRAERVTVTVRVEGARRVDRVRATSSGGFTAVFQSVEYDPCGGALFAGAVGSRGSEASLKLPQRECPPKL
jgi:hypothetical protein